MSFLALITQPSSFITGQGVKLQNRLMGGIMMIG